MNPLPSSSGRASRRDLEARKFGPKKAYCPNLFVSRLPKVQAKPNEKAEEIASLNAEQHRYFRRRKNPSRGTKTFTAANSNITVESRPKIEDSFGDGDLDVMKTEEVDDESSIKDPKVATKSYFTKFARASSAAAAHFSDLPVTIPCPRLSSPDGRDRTSKLISILMDSLDSPFDKSVKFLWKMPTFLPTMSTIHELPDGQIGKLQIMKSNRIRLVLGKCKLWLHPGIHVDFSEEVVFVDVNEEKKTGEIVKLGDIEERIIAVPQCFASFASDEPSERFEYNI